MMRDENLLLKKHIFFYIEYISMVSNILKRVILQKLQKLQKRKKSKKYTKGLGVENTGFELIKIRNKTYIL